MGIIDTLTNYGTKKVFENLGKSIIHDGKAISCIPPDRYAKRFYEFMINVVIAQPETDEEKKEKKHKSKSKSRSPRPS